MATVRYLVQDVDAAIAFYLDLGFTLEQQMGPAFAIVTYEDLSLWLAGPKSSAARPMPDGRNPVLLADVFNENGNVTHQITSANAASILLKHTRPPYSPTRNWKVNTLRLNSCQRELAPHPLAARNHTTRPRNSRSHQRIPRPIANPVRQTHTS